MVDQPPPNKLEHPCFPQPADTSVRVWRYLDLARFVWILENQKLYFSRVDLLNDPYEGSIPRFAADIRNRQMREMGADAAVKVWQQVTEQNRRSTYVNCWRIDNAESEAMWRLYCPGESGVAIQTSYQKLVDSLAGDPFCYIGQVTYIDYETDGFAPNNAMYPVMHKRIAFAYEREVRLVKTLPEFWGVGSPAGPLGIEIDWSAPIALDAVYVNPYAKQYYFDVVRAILRKFAPALEPRLTWSPMRALPSY